MFAILFDEKGNILFVDARKFLYFRNIKSPFARFDFGDIRMRFAELVGNILLGQSSLKAHLFEALNDLSVVLAMYRLTHIQNGTSYYGIIPKWDILKKALRSATISFQKPSQSKRNHDPMGTAITLIDPYRVSTPCGFSVHSTPENTRKVFDSPAQSLPCFAWIHSSLCSS
jgi:hypothetical protein